MGEPKLQEVKDVVKKARTASTPGPDGIPYKVYKYCPKFTTRLWKALKVIWRRGHMPDSWMFAEGCFIPKEENSQELSQFRTISLLNVEGKIFLAIMARRMTTYMLANHYIDVAVQKGGIPGVSGCLEHTGVLTQIIREVRKNKGDLAVLWLDLANAYGSIPHKLVELTLQKYHVPAQIQQLLKHYFDHFKMRFTVNDFTTSWQRLEVGIVTGCTISVILFAAAMNLLVKSAEKKSRGPVMVTGVKQPPTRAFMDDMTITTKTVVEGRWMLKDLEELIDWSRMAFKPAKSRSLVLRKGKVIDHIRFKIGGDYIPTVTQKPVKSLGKWFDDTLKDARGIKSMEKQANEWMVTVDRSGLPGKYKAWCYQHGILPRLLWPLLVYDVPLSKVELLEMMISRYLRRWLGVPRSLCSIGLYSTSSKLQLPLKSVTEEFKATKARQVMMLRDCRDDKVKNAGVQVKTGRKWSAAKAVDDAESRLRHLDIIGTVTTGRQGLGCITRSRWKTANATERRSMVQVEVRKTVEEGRHVRAVSMKKQGNWLRWDGARQKKLTWADVWKMESHKLSFLLKSVYDVLPSPTNLYTWGLAEDPNCKLCGRPANLEHVLSSCRTALTQGRYRWRHDRVLAALAGSIDTARKKERSIRKGQFIKFVKRGEEKKTNKDESGLLAIAKDWEMRADLKKQLVFPTEVFSTRLRPDIVLWSASTKALVMLELTVPWEERIEEAYERKKAKYQQLVEDCQQKGWKTSCLPVEVGARGFVGQSVWRALGILGMTGVSRKVTIAEIGRECEEASRWLWQRREQPWGK
jgi:hypothetical protein